MTTLPSLNEFLDHSVANGGSFLLLQLQSKWPSGGGIDHKNVGSVWPCVEDQKLGEKPQIYSLLINEETKTSRPRAICTESRTKYLFSHPNLSSE